MVAGDAGDSKEDVLCYHTTEFSPVNDPKLQAGQRKRMDPDPKSVKNWAGSGFGQKEYGSETLILTVTVNCMCDYKYFLI